MLDEAGLLKGVSSFLVIGSDSSSLFYWCNISDYLFGEGFNTVL
jgi:hypothetical protein